MAEPAIESAPLSRFADYRARKQQRDGADIQSRLSSSQLDALEAKTARTPEDNLKLRNRRKNQKRRRKQLYSANEQHCVSGGVNEAGTGSDAVWPIAAGAAASSIAVFSPLPSPSMDHGQNVCPYSSTSTCAG